MVGAIVSLEKGIGDEISAATTGNRVVNDFKHVLGDHCGWVVGGGGLVCWDGQGDVWQS